MSQIARERYHLVCRDCALERLFDVDDEAARLRREHARETDHRVVVGRVT
ncbi:hypothetical protein [Halorubrum sp. DTA46]